MIGYTRDDLWNHLKLDPLYEQWKNTKGEYHIDHIIPVKAFVEHGVLDVKIINALENLQILSAFDNESKGDKYLEEDYKQYINKFIQEIQ